MLESVRILLVCGYIYTKLVVFYGNQTLSICKKTAGLTDGGRNNRKPQQTLENWITGFCK